MARTKRYVRLAMHGRRKGEESESSSQEHARKNKSTPKPGQEVILISSGSSGHAKCRKGSINSHRKHFRKRTHTAIAAAEQNAEVHKMKKTRTARRNQTYLRSTQRTAAQDPTRKVQEEFDIQFGATNALQFDQRIKHWVDDVAQSGRKRSTQGQNHESGNSQDFENNDAEEGYSQYEAHAGKEADGDDRDGNACAEEEAPKDEQEAEVAAEREDDNDTGEDEDHNDDGGEDAGDDDYVEEESEEDGEDDDEENEEDEEQGYEDREDMEDNDKSEEQQEQSGGQEDGRGSDEDMADAQDSQNHQRPYQIDSSSAASGAPVERHRLTSRTNYLDRVEPGNTNPACEGFRRRMDEQGRHLNAYHWPNPVYYLAEDKQDENIQEDQAAECETEESPEDDEDDGVF